MANAPGRVVGDQSRAVLGLGILIPGYPQWVLRQRERAQVFLGTFAAAVGVGLFAWGSPLGWLMIGCAFAVHVASAADAIRQGAFPEFGRWVPTLSAAVGLALVCYAPVLVMASLFAWPGVRRDAPDETYMINRWAYRAAEPRPGDYLWYKTPRGGFALGRLVAPADSAVEWFDGSMRVNGQSLSWTPYAPDGPPQDLSLKVPEGQILVAPVDLLARGGSSCGLLLVPKHRLVGRVWAQAYPVWSRRLLF